MLLKCLFRHSNGVRTRAAIAATRPTLPAFQARHFAPAFTKSQAVPAKATKVVKAKDTEPSYHQHMDEFDNPDEDDVKRFLQAAKEEKADKKVFESAPQLFPFQTKLLSHDPLDTADYLDPIALREHHICEYDHSIKRLNLFLSNNPTYQDYNLQELIQANIPIATDLACHIANHNLFFDMLGPSVLKYPTGSFADYIERDFGSFEKFKSVFKYEALQLYGSGWVFLALDDASHLHIVVTENGGNPLQIGLIPILALDMWEHAYYSDYAFDVPGYIDAFFSAVQWASVEGLFMTHK